MSPGLRIAPEITLPVDAATETFGILAKKGAGKSNAAVVMAEEMYDAGIPWVAIDPKGDWWGLRSAGDGQGPGLPIIVFGGRHGDVPLEPTAGALLADLVLEQGLTCVLDVSEFTKADVRRFLLAFAERLYRQADAEPLHLFLEEAHEYLPQQVHGADAALVGAWQRIVKQGRFKGLGCTLVTQRSAALNKDVLTQVDTLIVLRTTSPQDRKAVKDWVDVHADAADMLATLPSLESGEAWLWSPEFLGTLQRIRFRRRRTFDSGATPKVGQKRRTPATLADVDLAAIKEQMAETIEKAKAEDPKHLRTRIRDLEREVEQLRATTPEPVVERIEVPVLPQDEQDRLLAHLREVASLLQQHPTELPPVAPKTPLAGPRRTDAGQPRRAARVAPTAPTRPSTPTAGQGSLSKTEQRVLDAIAWLVAVGSPQPTKIQTGFIAGYRVGKKVGGTFGNLLGVLRGAGLIDYPSPGNVALTEAGAVAATPADIEFTTEGLQRAIFERLTDPEQRVLSGIVDAYPDAIAKRDAGELAGYSVGDKVGGTFGNILGRLRSLGLVDYPAPGQVIATEVLFLGGAR
jgi:hypothetical protein